MKRLLLILTPLLLGLLLAFGPLELSIGTRTSNSSVTRSNSEARLEADAPDGNIRTVIRGRTAAVLTLGDTAMELAIRRGVAGALLDRSTTGEVIGAGVAGDGYRPGPAQGLPEIFAIVEILEHDSAWYGVYCRDRLRVNVLLGAIPFAVHDDDETVFAQTRIEWNMDFTTEFRGLVSRLSQKIDVAELVSEGFRKDLDELEWFAEATPDPAKGSGSLVEAAGAPESALDKLPMALPTGAAVRLVYSGRRPDGALESAWILDSNEPFFDLLESAAAAAEQDGWKLEIPVTTSGERLRAAVLQKGDWRMHLAPQRKSAQYRSDAEVVEPLAVVIRRPGV